jgi:hypothetical protein
MKAGVRKPAATPKKAQPAKRPSRAAAVTAKDEPRKLRSSDYVSNERTFETGGKERARRAAKR